MTLVIFTMLVSLGGLLGFSYVALGETSSSRELKKSEQSYYLSEAGTEDAAYRIIEGKAHDALETLSLGGFSATTVITNAGDAWEIVAEGNVESGIRTVRTILEEGTTGASFFYGMQAGYLGLTMENQSQIIGSVYSNGDINGKNDPVITGDAWVARGTASSANQEQLQQTNDLNIRDILSQRDAAQSFIPSVTAHANRISLYVKKIGTPADTNVRIVPDAGGVPDNSGTVAYGTLRTLNVTGNYGWVDATLSSDDALLQNQTYWIILDNNAHSASNYYILGGDIDASYPSGSFLYSSDWDAASPVWTVPVQGARDAAFKIFLGSSVTVLEGMVVRGHAHANTLEDSKICGDAYYQSADAATLNFLNSPTSVWCLNPLTPGAAFPSQPDPDPQNLPISQAQIDEFKAGADAGGVCAQPLCDELGNLERNGIGTTTIDTPLRIPGNLVLDNKAALILNGNLHVAGTLILKNTCRIELSSAYGSLSGVIVVDGTVTVENQCELVGSGDPASYLMILSTNPTLELLGAIHLKNSSVGAIFYASEGSMFLENQTNVKEAIAQKLYLKNQAIVTYETGLANVNFSSGPAGGYAVMRWKEVE